MHPYISIDIETTGLNPETCQILEIGAVYEDWTTPIEQLPTFHCYVLHDLIVGQPYALQMNHRILKAIADRVVGCIHVYNVARTFNNWLNKYWPCDKSIVSAGKNFAGFDRQFLTRLPKWNIKFKHRTIDPAMLYWKPGHDEVPPSTETCMERANITGTVAHTAVEDAQLVIRLIRRAYFYEDED